MKHVVIFVQGGIASLMHADDEIRVIILDYDNGEDVDPEVIEIGELKYIPEDVTHDAYYRDLNGDIANVMAYEDNNPPGPIASDLIPKIQQFLKSEQS